MRIGFIALSSSCREQARPAYTHPRHILPPLDLGYCMALARARGHSVYFFDGALTPAPAQEIARTLRQENCDLAVIKPAVHAVESARILTGILSRKPVITTVALGPVPTAAPGLFINDDGSFDLLIAGEPETAFSALLERCENRLPCAGIPGLMCRGETRLPEPVTVGDLDALPMPAHDLFLDAGYTFFYSLGLKRRMRFAAMLSSRGCPFPCAHCSPAVRVSHGARYRTRSPDNVMKEVAWLARAGVNALYFIDDNFTAAREHTAALCERFIQQDTGIAWAMQSRPDTLDDGLIHLLARAGCRCINLGIESASPRMMRALNKTIDLAHAERMIRACHAGGIQTNADFIVGIPGEEPADVEASLRFAQRMNFSTVSVYLFTPYPGTAVAGACPGTQTLTHASVYALPRTRENDLIEARRKHFYFHYYLRPGFILRYAWKSCSLKTLSAQLALLRGFLVFLLSRPGETAGPPRRHPRA